MFYISDSVGAEKSFRVILFCFFLKTFRISVRSGRFWGNTLGRFSSSIKESGIYCGGRHQQKRDFTREGSRKEDDRHNVSGFCQRGE